MKVPLLYDARGVGISEPKKIAPLTKTQMQVLVDAEAWWTEMGLAAAIHCPRCRTRHKADTTLDAWTLECECTIWRYDGSDIDAPLPPRQPHPREPLETGKRKESITRPVRQKIADFERLLFKDLACGYSLVCLRCQLAGDPVGVYGATRSEENSWIAECHCTIRTYRDAASANAPNVTH